MESSKLKCILCKQYPNGEVYECDAHHVGCVQCVDKLDFLICTCAENFNRKKDNPIEKLEKRTKVNCDYEESGCTWLFAPSDLERHLEECKFRPYRCIAEELKVMPCTWTGLQHEVEAHLKQDHRALGTPYNYFQESVKVPFFTTKSKALIKLVDAFSKHFLFYYFSNVATQMVYFMIIYFGRRIEARQYFYEFDIRSPTEHGVPRVKFIQQCVADCEDLEHLMEQQESCIAISFKTIKQYLLGDSIPFRFIVKKDVDKTTTRERKTSEKGKKQPESTGKRTPSNSFSLDDPPLRPIHVEPSHDLSAFPIF